MELTLWLVCTWYVPIVSLVLHRWMFDWLRKFAPTFQPIKYKSKISHDLVARVFPRLRKCAWLYLNLSWRERNSYLLIDRSNYFCFGLTTVYQKALYLCKFWLEFYILSDRFPCVDRLGRMVWIFFLVIICGCCLCFFFRQVLHLLNKLQITLIGTFVGLSKTGHFHVPKTLVFKMRHGV